ncbi:hypothetical protein ACQPZJ_22430 [Actinoplanes sp. CA-054009]
MSHSSPGIASGSRCHSWPLSLSRCSNHPADGPAAARLLDHYLHTAYAANMLLDPAQDPLVLGPPAPGVTVDPPAKYQEAMDWFTAERASLLAAVTLTGFDSYRHAVAIFHDLGDRYQEADTTTKLGDAHEATGDHLAAGEAWRHAHGILTELGHPEAAAVHAKLFPPQGS